MTFKVLLTDFAWEDVSVETELLAAAGGQLVAAPTADEATLRRLASDAAAIMTCWAPVTAAVIEGATECRIIARLGVGLDNIDVAAATSRGILVTNVPEYCTAEVAEHTLALLLALGRNLAWFDRACQRGLYQRNIGPPLRRLEGQTLGIVGLGAIGRTVARRAVGLGLNVIGTSRSRLAAPPEIAWRPLACLLEQSDFVSLHLPLDDSTRHLLGPAELARMKPTAFLINTARGGLVDPSALAEALAGGRLAGAALDVQDPEPPDLTRPPYNDPRVIVTPHTAFASRESLLELRTQASRQVIEAVRGGTPPHVVNPVVGS